MAIDNTQKGNLFLSGGTLYMYPIENGVETGDKVDMGATELTITRDTTTAEAFTKSGGLKQKIAEVVTEESYTMKIKSNSFSPANLAAALGGSAKEISFTADETLPNGEVAVGGEKFIKIEAGTNPLLTARLVFEGNPVKGKKVICVIHEATVKFGGDLPLMSEEFATADYEASAVKTDSGYLDYFIESV